VALRALDYLNQETPLMRHPHPARNQLLLERTPHIL